LLRKDGCERPFQKAGIALKVRNYNGDVRHDIPIAKSNEAMSRMLSYL
jgi:hypothetical protein